MSSAGPNSCGVGIDNGGGGSSWSNPAYIQANDALSTSCTINAYSSNFLVAKNFGFAIPDEATIENISFAVSALASLPEIVYDYVVNLFNNGNVGNNVYKDTPLYDASQVFTYAGDADYWGVALTPELVNSANFGLALQYHSWAVRIAYVQYVSCTITYSLPAYTIKIGDMNNSPSGIVDEMTISQEIKSDQWIRRYCAWATGKL
jgi:hypothetical protein